MNIEDSNRFGVLSENDLVIFEEKLGVKLPEEYRIFLKAHNGGKPAKSNIHHMYGIHNGPWLLRLEHAEEIYSGRIPLGLLPFADNAGGDQYCLGVSSDTFGKVYFWDHEQEGLLEITAAEEIAESFSDFVETTCHVA